MHPRSDVEFFTGSSRLASWRKFVSDETTFVVWEVHPHEFPVDLEGVVAPDDEPSSSTSNSGS